MKNVLKMFAVAAICITALTGTSYANTAKGKSSGKNHAKHSTAKSGSHVQKAPMKTGK